MRTNYIHRLEDERAELRAKAREATHRINEILRYLDTPKFARPENWVNVNDIIPRLYEARMALLED